VSFARKRVDPNKPEKFTLVPLTPLNGKCQSVDGTSLGGFVLRVATAGAYGQGGGAMMGGANPLMPGGGGGGFGGVPGRVPPGGNNNPPQVQMKDIPADQIVTLIVIMAEAPAGAMPKQ